MTMECSSVNEELEMKMMTFDDDDDSGAHEVTMQIDSGCGWNHDGINEPSTHNENAKLKKQKEKVTAQWLFLMRQLRCGLWSQLG